MILFFISFCKQTNLKITVKHSSYKEMRFTVKRIPFIVAFEFKRSDRP